MLQLGMLGKLGTLVVVGLCLVGGCVAASQIGSVTVVVKFSNGEVLTQNVPAYDKTNSPGQLPLTPAPVPGPGSVDAKIDSVAISGISTSLSPFKVAGFRYTPDASRQVRCQYVRSGERTVDLDAWGSKLDEGRRKNAGFSCYEF